MKNVYKSIDEAASTVFKKSGVDQYVVEKTRIGDVVRGATYSKGFVIAYAEENVNVYVKGGI